MPTVAAGGGHILNIDFFCCPSDNEAEERGEQGEKTIPKQGKASSVAEASADTQAELETQKVIKRWSEDAQRLKDENADLKRRLEELEEKHKSSPVPNHQFWNVILNNVISNNCSPLTRRLHPWALQRARNRNQEAHWQRNRPSCSTLFMVPFTGGAFSTHVSQGRV